MALAKIKSANLYRSESFELSSWTTLVILNHPLSSWTWFRIHFIIL